MTLCLVPVEFNRRSEGNLIKPHDAILVRDIAGDKAVLDMPQPATLLNALFDLGFLQEGERLMRPVADDEDRTALIRKLIALDALFIGGPGWSPAEVVAYHRDRQSISGLFREIVWNSPEAYEVRER